MRDPNPTVILIPGIGMIAWGKDKSESRVTAEFYNCAVEVMRGAEAIDRYIALAAAGSVRHRILAARGSEAEAHAAGKGTGAAGHRCGGRGQRHRQGSRAPARQRRRARCLRGPGFRSSAGHGERTDGRARHWHRRRGHRNFRVRSGRRRCMRTSPIARACATCSNRRSSLMADSIP